MLLEERLALTTSASSFSGVANEEHLRCIKEGVEAWNRWRGEEYIAEVDLTDANLTGAHLDGARLERADLQGAILVGASLRSANLRAANLYALNTRKAPPFTVQS